jgi:hypothetical protein
MPATPRFVDAVEQLARSGRRAPDERLIQPSPWRGVVRRLALATRSGSGAWLLMDSLDAQRTLSERARGEQKQARPGRARSAVGSGAPRPRRQAAAQAGAARGEGAAAGPKERRQQWRRWRYALGTSGPVARLKGGLRLLFGARHQ